MVAQVMVQQVQGSSRSWTTRRDEKQRRLRSVFPGTRCAARRVMRSIPSEAPWRGEYIKDLIPVVPFGGYKHPLAREQRPLMPL
jgi:hypothetical protein